MALAGSKAINSCFWTGLASCVATATTAFRTIGGGARPLLRGRQVVYDEEGEAITRNTPGLVRDCEALLAARDALGATIPLNWSAETDYELLEGCWIKLSWQRPR